MNNSRSKNAVLNIGIGLVAQLGLLLLSFVGRRVFLQFLSADYLGINGLYSNILSVLALAELGLGNVTQFFLYKPVAEGDTQTIAALMKYFRKMYTVIAFVVLGLGIAMIPTLSYIVNSNLPQNELVIYYVIFLLNSCVTYFSADKIALLAANQDNRLTKYITLGVHFVLEIAHIIVLFIWHNYVVYVFATLISSLVNVIITNVVCNKRYAYVSNQKNVLSKEHKKTIAENVKSTFVYKIGATIVNNTDNILISVMVSTAAVGLYSNYFMVVSGIQAFIVIATTALISGIGNLSAYGDKSRMKTIFNFLVMFYHFIAAYGGICFFFLFNDLIPIWLGNGYTLDMYTVFAIAFAFYSTNAISPVWMFRESNGLFNKVKYLLFTTAICNIILSVALGKLWGVFGILIATSISRIITQVWYEPKILFKNLFECSCFEYFARQGKYTVLTFISSMVCWFINSNMPHSFTFIVLKALLFFVVCLTIFFVFCRKSNEFGEIKKFAGFFKR